MRLVLSSTRVLSKRDLASITLATRMATAPLANPMPPFDPDSEIGANIGPKWEVWLEDFEMYITANGITDKKQKRALLLYQAGSRVREIFRQLPDRGEDDDYDTAVTKLNGYFEPQKESIIVGDVNSDILRDIFI